jgi:hypothetical protein
MWMDYWLEGREAGDRDWVVVVGIGKGWVSGSGMTVLVLELG